MKYQELSSKPDFSEIQPKVIEFWKENKVFEESLKTGKKGEVVFYDGPPFPTGKPHHGTVLVSFIKDMIARYWTMRGFQVPRVWGWDCHGLYGKARRVLRALHNTGKKVYSRQRRIIC